MSEHLHQPDEQGDVVDQTEVDLVEGPSSGGGTGPGLIAEDPPQPGSPAAATPIGTVGEVVSRGVEAPAGPGSSTSGTGTGTGADRGEEGVPPQGGG